MMVKPKLVAVREYGVTQIHFPHQNGNHYTLCGMDGADEYPLVDQSIVDVPRNARVNCRACISMFDVLKHFSEADVKRPR